MELSWVMSTTRVARGMELLQHGQHLPPGVGVQGAGGLVGQDDLRLSDKSAGHSAPLFLAAGHLIGVFVQQPGDSQGIR